MPHTRTPQRVFARDMHVCAHTHMRARRVKANVRANGHDPSCQRIPDASRNMGKRKKSTRTPGAGRKKMPPLGTLHWNGH